MIRILSHFFAFRPFRFAFFVAALLALASFGPRQVGAVSILSVATIGLFGLIAYLFSRTAEEVEHGAAEDVSLLGFIGTLLVPAVGLYRADSSNLGRELIPLICSGVTTTLAALVVRGLLLGTISPSRAAVGPSDGLLAQWEALLKRMNESESSLLRDLVQSLVSVVDRQREAAAQMIAVADSVTRCGAALAAAETSVASLSRRLAEFERGVVAATENTAAYDNTLREMRQTSETLALLLSRALPRSGSVLHDQRLN